MTTARATPRKLHGWRKLAGAAWSAPDDPQFYGELEVDAGSLLEYQQALRTSTGVHVTLTHLVGRSVAHGLLVVPAIGMRLARGREHARTSTDLFFIVASGSGEELTGVKVERVNEKSAVDLARELTVASQAIEDGIDVSFGRTKRLLETLPPWALRPALRVGAWLTSDLDLDLPRLGLRRESFGSAMISSVGMWGVRRAYAPLARCYRVPVLILVGAVQPRPAAVAGQVVVRPMLTLTATFDHRHVDGSHAARFAKAIQEYCADPGRFEPGVVAGDTAAAEERTTSA